MFVRSPEIAENQKTRDPFFDNARFLAVVLVVIGHTVTLLPPTNATHPAVLLLQTFRMPLLIIVTGHLARNFVLTDEKVRGLITRIALPYVVFETLYSLYAWHTGVAEFKMQFFLPTYLMWFLMSVMIWRLTVPFWRNVRWPLAIAVALSILSYTHAMPHELTLRRVFSLLPFFVLGVCSERKHFQFLKKPASAAVGVLVLAGGITFYYTGGRYVPEYWTYWDRGYAWLDVGLFPGVLIHIGVLLLATALAVAVLTLVPRRRTWFTAFGAKTMYAYLLHGFGTMTIVHFGLHETAFMQTIPGMLISAAGAAVVATLLCTPPVTKVTRGLIEPKATWLFPSAAPPPGTSTTKPVQPARPDRNTPPAGTPPTDVVPAGTERQSVSSPS
ncbi:MULTISPECIES: acyltransferase family protein [unclassified Spirillospora]|uniref:acyltransferase family protein n=1 Tax=unclassified Spirillospora TaxID=2642701 RepID=UPI00371B4C8B